jgi:hypothetical protein
MQSDYTYRIGACKNLLSFTSDSMRVSNDGQEFAFISMRRHMPFPGPPGEVAARDQMHQIGLEFS